MCLRVRGKQRGGFKGYFIKSKQSEKRKGRLGNLCVATEAETEIDRAEKERERDRERARERERESERERERERER